MTRVAFLLISLVTIVSSCRRQGLAVNDCDALKAALNAQDKGRVSEQVESMLLNYNRKNVDRFAETLSADCGISVKNVCFSCIKTLPEQTSIHLEFNLSGVLIQRELDLSYNPDNNEMIVSGVHE